MEPVQRLAEMIAAARSIVFFGGAGVSTASGIPDFRSAYGLYNRQREGQSYEEMLSIGYMRGHPDEFWHFYKTVLLYPDAQPNAAHRALARLEAQGKLRAIVTQNIDGLHQAAGSQSVLELHGAVRRNLCCACGRCYDLGYVLRGEGAPRCACGGMLRPDVVLYGEALDGAVLDAAIRAIRQCDLLLVGGTSLVVYPAAGLITYARGAKLVLLNRDATPFDDRADLILRDDIAAVLDAAIPA